MTLDFLNIPGFAAQTSQADRLALVNFLTEKYGLSEDKINEIRVEQLTNYMSELASGSRSVETRSLGNSPLSFYI